MRHRAVLPLLAMLAASLCMSLTGLPSAGAVSWEDTPQTTRLWETIRLGNAEALSRWLEDEPSIVEMRAADGRGGLHWAYEFGRMDLVKVLKDAGADEDDKDKHGYTPAMLLNKSTPPPAPPRYTQPQEDDEDDEDEEEDEEEDERDL